jgi:hypothetical protein
MAKGLIGCGLLTSNSNPSFEVLVVKTANAVSGGDFAKSTNSGPKSNLRRFNRILVVDG